MPFTKKPQVKMGDYSIGYWEWLPDSYSTGKDYPVIIAFHGVGQAGNGSSTALDSLLVNGVPKLIKEQGFPYEAIVLCPQYSGSLLGAYAFNALIDYIKANYKAGKICVTGLSGGANTITEWLADKNNISKICCAQFVCVVYGYSANIAANIAKLPSWYYVGEKDELGSFNMTKAWVAGIKDFGGSTVLKSWANEYHNVWGTVYDYNGKYIDNKNWAELMLDKAAGVQPPTSGIEAEFTFPGGKYTLFTDGKWSK
jgi:predicted peptidase